MPTNTNWSGWKPIELQGEPDGMIRWKRRPGPNVYINNPFERATVLCNPDRPNSVTISETKSISAGVNISVTATFGGKIGGVVNSVNHSLQTRVGVDIRSTETFQLNKTVNGERCRSVQYEFFIDYDVFDVEVVPPDASSIGAVTFAVWKPIGWWPRKKYVPPTCCSKTTGQVGMRLDSKHEDAVGESKYALGRAARAAIVARGYLSGTDQFVEAFEAYGDAVEAMLTVRRNGGEVEEELETVFGIVDNLVAPSVQDIVDPATVARNTATASELLERASVASEHLSAARELRHEDPVESMAKYVAAQEELETAWRLRDAMVTDMDALPEPSGGFTAEDLTNIEEDTEAGDEKSRGA